MKNMAYIENIITLLVTGVVTLIAYYLGAGEWSLLASCFLLNLNHPK